MRNLHEILLAQLELTNPLECLDKDFDYLDEDFGTFDAVDASNEDSDYKEAA